MTLFVSKDTTYTDSAILELADIVGGDGGFGYIDYNVNPIRIQYTQSIIGFAQNRINEIVNTIPNSIIITAGDCSVTLPDGTMLCNIAGKAFGPDAAGNIHVIYDVTQARGSNYFVFDDITNKISNPNNVILFHVLAQAYHFAIGDAAINPITNYKQTTRDENGFRFQKRLALRSLSDYRAGSGFAGGGMGDCLVATATYGSPIAPQVQTLRELRNAFVSDSALGREFFVNLLNEYYKFSPLIANKMTTSSSSRLGILVSKLLVEPLINFFTLTRKYLLDDDESTKHLNFIELTKINFKNNLKELVKYDFDRYNPAYIVNDLEHFERCLYKGEKKCVHEDSSLPQEIKSILEYFFNEIKKNVPDQTYLLWAFVDPLIIYWSTQSRFIEDKEISMFFISSLHKWLDKLPIPISFSNFDERTFKKDLKYLSKHIFKIPHLRKRFGKRLFDIYEKKTSFDLQRVLLENDYLP